MKTFIESSNDNCEITACDLFDEFPYNAADWDTINEKWDDIEWDTIISWEKLSETSVC